MFRGDDASKPTTIRTVEQDEIYKREWERIFNGKPKKERVDKLAKEREQEELRKLNEHFKEIRLRTRRI